ncbi:MAG: DNA topoisomerase 3 [Cyanobacteria bacterium SZAS TMP-1]|nr:DNA topoisomerase 3 [Cyanobacteria bacterium SZAS TMP-1]
MKVVLTEKPSVARDIAAVVGAKNKKDGYYEGNGYVVTYAFGHLVTLAEPEEMNPAWAPPWRLNQLPMLPEEWKYRVVDKTKNQFNVIKKFFLDPAVTSIVCATDAGREGEHIFRLIYKLTGCTKSFERLWISSLTSDAIKDGLTKLKPSADFDNLASAATARAHADWVVGLNFTRAYTNINRQLCTVGRVQTPTLALIVDRQLVIENFQSKPFYEILATFEPGFVARYITPGAEPQTRLTDKAQAQAIVKAITPLDKGKVVSVVTSEKKTKAPALYDLLTLQKEANKRFGYTAAETLTIAQSLYEEHKLISYPRTESRHLSTDMVQELPRILSTVLKSPGTSPKVLAAFAAEKIVPGSITAGLLRPKLTKSYVDDTKLTDHHAIIPTHNTPPSNLPEKQSNVYQLVAMRFLSIFLPPEVRDETTAIIALAEHSFRAKGVVLTDPGWTVVDPKANEEEKKKTRKAKDKDGEGKEGKDSADEAQTLPPLAKDQEVKKTKNDLKESKTSPPKPYDDGSLLTAMKNAGQELDDEDLASYMKQKGLGTPATRAAIIERLLQTGYIERNKKSLAPTEKGRALISQIHNDLRDIALTATWEQRLADMQDGKLQLNKFEEDIAGFVRKILPEVISTTAAITPKPTDGIGPCPQCKQGVVRPTPKGAGCHRWKEGCTFTIWREQRGKTLSDNQIKDLILKGQTKEIKGFKKKDGSGTYDAVLVIGEDFKVGLQGFASPAQAGAADGAAGGPPKSSAGLGNCPQCGQGTVRQTPKGAGCSRWKEGCTLSIWREQYGRVLTDEEMIELITARSTGLLKGFKKKDGSGTYDARLVFNSEFKVRLDFGQKPQGPEPDEGKVAARPAQPVGAAEGKD